MTVTEERPGRRELPDQRWQGHRSDDGRGSHRVGPIECRPYELGNDGVPVNSADGYDKLVYWDVHISDSGEYVHAAPWSVDGQGPSNVSHGCINLSDGRSAHVLQVQPSRKRRARRRRTSGAGGR